MKVSHSKENLDWKWKNLHFSFICRNKTDNYLLQFPTVIRFKYEHNHNILCAASLRHRDVSKATEEKLTSLFYKKYGPTAALEALKYDLQLEHGDQYYKVAGDRSVCPDLQYCSRWGVIFAPFTRMRLHEISGKRLNQMIGGGYNLMVWVKLSV